MLEQEENKTETHQPKPPVGVRLRLEKKNLILAGLLLLLLGAVLFLERALLWEETETGETVFQSGFLGTYACLSLAGVLLCLTEIKLPELSRRIAGWALVLLTPLGTFFAVDLINGTRILQFSPLRSFANYLCYLMVFALLYAVSRRAWVTALAGGGAFLFFGIVNYFVIQFRGQPILPWDISAMGTAMEVSGGYKFLFTRPMVLSAAGLVCAVLLCLRLAPGKREKAAKGSRIAERLCAFGLSALLFVMIFPADLLSGMGISVWPWNQKTSSEITGVMAGFFANIQFLMVDKPEGYSQESVEKLGAEIDSMEEPAPLGYPEKPPTVIAIMNESMTDLQNVGDVEFQPDNLPFLHSLQESGNVIWGTAYSSVYGGDTCNSEYEFLTGNTMAFLPSGSKPYQQYVDRQQTALPSILSDYGYVCTAIHPGNRGAWQRNTAYPYLDFDEFISARDFDVKRELIHGLTSDASSYDQVIYEYEHRDREKGLFLFNVTIQNHGGYEDEDVPVTVRIKKQTGNGVYAGEVVGPQGQDPQGQESPVTVRTEGSQEGGVQTGETVYPQAEQYLSLTKESDTALQELLAYFEAQEDPVVVLFFGDHWPNLETGFLSDLLGADANHLEFEDTMRKYQVPFVIWANYPLESQRIEAVSINYLSGLLLRAAGIEGTPYTRYLEGLRQQLPVITAIGTMDREGSLYKNGEETPYDRLLNEYAVLQYNNAFDEEEKVEKIFTVDK